MRFEFSAGGIVYKKQEGKTLVLLGQHSQHHGWGFPKGLIGDIIKGESKEETALREVEEETGVTARILKPLEPVTYWFQFKGEKIKKTVYYFVMEYVKGDTKDHDFEMEKVEWVAEEEVEERLTFSSDKKIWQSAKQLLNALL